MKIKVEQGKCPLCGSENVSYENSETEDNAVWYSCCCEDCGASWDENYAVTFESVGCVRDKDGNEVCKYAEPETRESK